LFVVSGHVKIDSNLGQKNKNGLTENQPHVKNYVQIVDNRQYHPGWMNERFRNNRSIEGKGGVKGR
jgi:hypothetical protein